LSFLEPAHARWKCVSIFGGVCAPSTPINRASKISVELYQSKFKIDLKMLKVMKMLEQGPSKGGNATYMARVSQ
jgi:hypothetical protein